MSAARARVWAWARVLVSVGLLVVVARRVPLADAAAALRRVHPATLAIGVALALAGYVGRSVRWHALLARAGVRVSQASAWRLTLVGVAYGLATPGRVGELARTLHVEAPRARTLPSVLWDRLSDVLLLELLSIPALVSLGWARGVPGLIAALVLAATVAVAIALDRPAVAAALARRVPALTPRLAHWQLGAAGVLGSRAMWTGLAGGLAFYALNFAAAWLLLQALAPVHAPALARLFPLIILLGNLPVAFGGLGLREQVAASAFARLGASAAIGPVFSLLWFAVITVVPALIGLLLVHTRWRHAGARLVGERA